VFARAPPRFGALQTHDGAQNCLARGMLTLVKVDAFSATKGDLAQG